LLQIGEGEEPSPPALLHGWKKDKNLTPSPSPNWRGELSEHLSPLHLVSEEEKTNMSDTLEVWDISF